jgi:4-hydroxybenzoate polyprenyltransferase
MAAQTPTDSDSAPAEAERPAEVQAPDRSAAALIGSVVKAMRPKQALKNLFIFAALVFAGHLTDPVKGPRNFALTLIAFALFTLVAGSVYLLNDILDVEQDRLHPEKRDRPIASGRLPVSVAWVVLVIVAVGGLGASLLVDLSFGIVVAGYFLMQIAYCLALKRIVLLDVFTIAAGFVLRTVAGAMIIHVHISQWLLLCTLQLALFLGFGKRRQELVKLGADAGKHREILDEYSVPFLDQMINIVAGVTIVCYSVYTIESDTAKLHPHLWITVPFVIYGVCRYLYLVYQRGWGGAPDEALRKDRMLQLSIVLWFVCVMVLFVVDKAGLPLLRVN